MSIALPDPDRSRQRQLAAAVHWPALLLWSPAAGMLAVSAWQFAEDGFTTYAIACALAALGGIAGLLVARRRLQQRILRPAAVALDRQAHDRAVFEASRDGIVVVDQQGIIRSFSPSAESMFGACAADVIGQPVTALMPALDAPRPDPARARRRLQLGPARAQREVLGRRPDGSTFPLSLYVKRIDLAGAAPMFCHVFRDLTEQVQNEQAALGHALQIEQANVELAQAKFEAEDARTQAEAANRSKSEFLANMSHEIRTPMTAILGFAENLLDPDLPQTERREAVETILRNGDHLMALIDDILDLSKIEAGRLTIERVPFAPVELVRDVIALMRVRADTKRLSLSVCADGPLPTTIASDPTRLRQVLINLIGNAIKFTERGAVTLTLRLLERGADDALLQFEVRDTGIGMSPDQLARLFRPFSQADSSTTRRFGGTGLGLSICKRLVEMLGGTIDVTSEPELGSAFTFTIHPGALAAVPRVTADFDPEGASTSPPATEAASTDAAPARTAAATAEQLSGRILLAEDGPDNQRLITFLLRKFGADVTVVADGQSAVDAALAAETGGAPFDLVLMDMQMPVMDGYQATGELRRTGFRKPIVALTANAMAGDRERCLAAGCTDFTPKPVERRTLHSVLQRLLPHPPAEA